MPTITNIAPTTVQAGGSAFALIVNGTGFVNGSVVIVDDTVLVTTFVNTTQLVGQVTADLLLSPGNAFTVVRNPDNSVSNQTFFIVSPGGSGNPPNITTTSFPRGTQGVAFSQQVTVSNGQAPLAFSISVGGLPPGLTILPSSGLISGTPTQTGFWLFTARVTDGNNVSDTQALRIDVDPSAPVLSSLSPNNLPEQGAGFTLTLNGSNFAPSAQAKWQGEARVTTFVSSTQLTAQILASDISVSGIADVTVVQGAFTSAVRQFTINPAPQITVLVPATSNVGGAQFNVVVAGFFFESGAVMTFNGVDSALTTFISDQEVRGRVTAANQLVAGSYPVTVRNPSGLVSLPAYFTVAAASGTPAPSASLLSPSFTDAGSAAFTLTVNGANFVSGAKVRWNGADRTTTFVSATQLTAAITAPDVATVGTASVSVINPDNQVSANLTFTVNTVTNPAPVLASLSPSSAYAGATNTEVLLTGSNFVSGAVARAGATSLATTFISSVAISATVPANLLTSVGSISLSVLNPDSQVSVARTLSITQTPNPSPVANGLSPSTVAPGSAGFSLTVNGSGFVAGSVVRVGGQSRQTTWVSGNQLIAQIPSGDVAAVGTLSITVFNPTPGGGTSSALTLTVANAGTGQPTLAAGLTPIRATLRMRQGNTFAQSLVLRKNGVAYNLTGVSAKLQVRRDIAQNNAPILLDLTTINGGLVIDPMEGRITINATDVQTAALTVPEARFELAVTTLTGIVVTVAVGDVRVSPRITL